MVTPDQFCPTCQRPLKQRNGESVCPNGCDRLTARAPDHNTAGSMSYESMGDGCFVKKPSTID